MIYTNYPLVLFPADISWHLTEKKIGTSVLLSSKSLPRSCSVARPYGGDVFTFLSFIRHYRKGFVQLLKKEREWIKTTCNIHFLMIIRIRFSFYHSHLFFIFRKDCKDKMEHRWIILIIANTDTASPEGQALLQPLFI